MANVLALAAVTAAVLVRKARSTSANLSLFRDLIKRYRYLYQEKVIQNPDGSSSFHRGQLFKRRNIHVLHLRGDHFEMAFQHGRLLKDAIRQGVLAELNRVIPNIIQNSVSKNPAVVQLLLRVMKILDGMLLRRIPRKDLIESFALSEGAGLSLDDISGALLSIESLNILSKYAVRSHQVQMNYTGMSGCSSFVAWGDRTPDGELIIGRNLDYQLNGFFDAHPVVTYFEPTDSSQAYVSIGSAGLHTPVLTAFNESGIFISVHIVPTAETSFNGTPVYFVNSEVIRHARTFDEAVTLFKKFRPTAGWACQLVSMREKRVGTVEMTYERTRVSEAAGTFHSQTNHFRSPEMESANLFINRSIDEDSLGRCLRMEELLHEMRGTLGKEAAASILGDQWDRCEKKVRGLGNTVGVHITVGSVVILPHEQKFYVATGMAPVSHNDYVEFPWVKKLDSQKFMSEKFAVIEGGEFEKKNGSMAKAIRLYIEAKVQYENYSNVDRAFELMKEVVALDCGNAAYQFVLAIFALKKQEMALAAQVLEKILTLGHTLHLQNMAHYYLGRIALHQGKREAATERFEKVFVDDSPANAKLRSAAQGSLNITRIFGRYPLRGERLQLMMQFADLLNY